MEKMNIFGDNQFKSEISKAAFGIDLGTTNSAIGIIKSGSFPDIVQLENGAVTLPSCVMWKGKPGEFIVGREAYNNRYKESAIYSVKRMMGSGETITLKYGGKELVMTPAQVSAEILKELVKQAEKEFGVIKDVVITVPAYFDNKQIEDTLEAGRLANLNVLGILREPTSAALVYNQKDKEEKQKVVLVYDLGGGTFDISLVRIAKQEATKDLLDIYDFEEGVSDKSKDTVLTVLKNEGDMRLGGDDIDQELYKIFEAKLKSQGVDVKFLPKEQRERYILELENVKKAGSGLYKIPLDFKLNDLNGTPVKSDVTINPADFNTAIGKIYKKTKKLVDVVLADTDLSTIDAIVLVGGSTKSEVLKDCLRKDFPGIAINDALNPDESVALGAGIQAKRLKFGDDSMEVFDILPLSIGVLADGFVSKIIMKNQTVPYSFTKVFSTTQDNQESINIEVYQGNSPLKEECLYLGNLIVGDLPKGRAGTVGIPINLAVDANGVLNCSVNINGKVSSTKLVNLFGKNNTLGELTAKDRKIIRWRKFANNLDNSASLALNGLLDNYAADKIKEEVILDFISQNKPKVDVSKPREIVKGVEF